MEDAIFRLKPGELTAPLRGSNGWYVFALERRGREVTATERQQGWQNVLAERGSAYLEELRRAAKITSAIPLAAPKPPQAQQVPIPPDQLPPPPPS